MSFYNNLTKPQQRHMLAMAERLDDHFAKAAFAAHRPVSYGRLSTQIGDHQVRYEEMAFHHDELVALHSAVFDLPDIAFHGDDAIAGLAKRYVPEVSMGPAMIRASYTFMQWLGTNVGRSFIRDLHAAFDKHDKLERHAAVGQIDDLHHMLITYFSSSSRCNQKPLNAVSLGVDGKMTPERSSAAHQSRYALLALSTYLNLQHGGAKPDTRNVFDYNMDPHHGTSFTYYAEDEEQVAAMSLVAWLGTSEGVAHLRFLDAHRVDALAA